ncbi:cytosine permease [Streptomyces sp. NPDC090032]|uniref:cytosine permease n=1 Tax=Streptomyces sp. NPDC090032 TaxID=3365925 RepID=UPI0038225AB8
MPIETRGVDTVPDDERTSRPRDLVSILLGSNLALGVIIFGALPVTFGLGWWDSFTALLTGTVVGSILVAPLSLVSLRTATNLSTSSGAAFGVRGRLLGSIIGLLLSLGYTALTLWVGGDSMVGALHRVVGLPANGVTTSIVYAALAFATAFGAVFGYKLLLRMSRVLSIGMTILLILGVVAYWPHFTTAAPDPSGYALGGFWQTWILSAVAAGLSGPIAFITLLGDYTRYISPRRHSSKAVYFCTYVGLMLGLLVPQLFGTFTAIAVNADDWATGLVAGAPSWYLVPLILAASAGSVGNAGLMLYSMGLDMDAILPKATRTRCTYVIAGVSTVLVYAGHFLWSATNAMTAFVLMLTALCTPWAVITLINHIRSKARYDSESLQVYNRGSVGGIYWFQAGWNVRAALAWAIGATVGVLCVDATPTYTGPVVAYTGGIDFSFLLSATITALAYLTLNIGQRPPTVPASTEAEKPTKEPVTAG